MGAFDLVQPVASRRAVLALGALAGASATPRLVAPGSAQASTTRMRWARAWPTPRRRSTRRSESGADKVSQ